LTGHVRNMYDPSGIVSGQLTGGQAVTGQYTYETSVPDTEPDPMYGVYSQTPSQGAIRLSTGSLVFESDPAAPYWRFDVTVHPSYYPGYYWSSEFFNIDGLKPLTNGAAVNSMVISLQDSSGHTPSSEYLPTGAPDLSKFSEKSINVFGNTATNSFAVEIIIDSVSVNPPTSGLIVSPASGSFSRLQRFDAALLL